MFQIGPREIGADLAFGVDLALFILQCSCRRFDSWLLCAADVRGSLHSRGIGSLEAHSSSSREARFVFHILHCVTVQLGRLNCGSIRCYYLPDKIPN